MGPGDSRVHEAKQDRVLGECGWATGDTVSPGRQGSLMGAAPQSPAQRTEARSSDARGTGDPSDCQGASREEAGCPRVAVRSRPHMQPHGWSHDEGALPARTPGCAAISGAQEAVKMC